MKSYTIQEAQIKMQRFCAYQERCHREVEQKLRQMRMIPDAIDVIIVNLIKEDFLNEERFAKSYARGKFRIKKWGWIRIKQGLKAKNISKYNIDLAFEEIEEEYLDTFEKIALQKKESILEENPLKARKKFIDYLIYRGWESDLVYEKAEEFYSLW